MEEVGKIHLNILDKIHGRHMESESSSSSSDSEQETESKNSFETSRSGASDVGTPRSLTSNESSAVTSPRGNLLWDHGFDVANGERQSLDNRDAEWRRFSNKTDDDKIIADKRSKIQEIAHKLQEINDRETKTNSKTGRGLPDLIPSASLSSVHSSLRSSQETLYAIEDLDLPPPLPDSDPPNIDLVDLPPPLPASSPPTLNSLKENESEQIEETVGTDDFERVKNEHSATGNDDNSDTSSDDTSKLCNENPDGFESESDCSSSAAGDLSDDDEGQREINFDGFYNVQTHTVLKMNSDSRGLRSQPEVLDDVEAEFDYILQSLNLESEPQDTYIERFAGRRDRYGFILSPVIEAPSPTPSNVSGYSGYSGISCSSPDPLGIFRMSPGPNRGSRQELDLSSLCVKPNEWDLGNEQTVPIYQTVHAKKALVIPEGFGWDSGDDLLSPTGSGDWDYYANGLSTPPVSTSSVNLTQFGTHITGWKQPDIAIYEEPENYNSDTTIDNEDTSDTDTTIDDDSPRSYSGDISKVTVKECESPEKNLYIDTADMKLADYLNTNSKENDGSSENVNIINESVQPLELSDLEDGINEIENELKLLKIHAGRNDDLIKNGKNELYEIKYDEEKVDSNKCDEANIETVSLDSSLNDSFHGFSAEIAQINQRHEDKITSEQSQSNENVISINSSLDRRCRKLIRVDSKQTCTTTDDESDTTEESNEDAEDEYSDSDNENHKEENIESDFELFKAKPASQKENDSVDDVDVLQDKDSVSVSELLSPRSAILLSGGMFPEETSTSTFTSDEADDLGDITPDTNMSSYGSGIKISQYTSGDSDDNCTDVMKSKTDGKEPDNIRVDHQTTTDVECKKQTASPEQKDRVGKETNAVLTNTVTIHNQLDFSILESKFELRKSPRIFGRYYAEMDDQLLEEVRLKRDSAEHLRSEPEQVENNTAKSGQHATLFGQETTFDVDEFENSFRHVDITNSSNIKCKEKLVDDHKENLNLDPVVAAKKNCVKEEAMQDNFNFRHENINVSEKTNPPFTDAKVNLPRDRKVNSLKKDDYGILPKSSPKKSSLLKIKIGHLNQSGSARCKIKRGYVHELSELFDKSNTKPSGNELETKKSKIRRVEIERAQTPKMFTPNENMVIYEKSTTDSFGDNDNFETQERLGFEVTPLQKVTSFEDIQRDETMDRGVDEESRGHGTFHYSSDENSSDTSDVDYDDELKRYEDQLREIQTDREEYNDDYKGEANVLEDMPVYNGSGTSEFMPMLDTFVEINTQDQSLKNNITEAEKNHLLNSHMKLESDCKIIRNECTDDEQQEIEESIDGDTDPNQSEDEEFHQRYSLPGQSYHINDSGSGTNFAEWLNREAMTTIDTAITKHEFLEASDCEAEENFPIASNEMQNSNGGNHLEQSQQEFSRYEDCKPGASSLTQNVKQTAGADEGALAYQDDTTYTNCETRSKHSNTEDSHVDMSRILRQIPWKPLKDRKQETSTANSAKSGCGNTRKQSGYLYDIISRINTQPKPAEAEFGIQENVSNRNEAIVRHSATKDSPTCLDFKDKLSPTALSEKGEFDFLEESTENVPRESKTATAKYHLLSRRHVSEYNDDPQFKIRYPSSLSRRLYGPYSRLRSKETVLFEDENERETNPPVLMQSSTSNRNSVTDGDLLHVACQHLDGLNRRIDHISFLHKENEFFSENHEGSLRNEDNVRTDGHSHVPFMTQSPNGCGEISDTESSTDNLSIHSDDQNSNPDTFNHTCYDVKTPFSSITQRDGIKFNLTAITGGERNQAQQKPLVCENNFVIVNLQHVRNEAKIDKQNCDSSYGRDYCDVKLTTLPMHLECRSVDNKHGHEINGEINNNNLGVDTNTVAVKNGDHYTSLGVRIPLELSANETKQQNVDMNNDLVSTSHKISLVETNKPGINRVSASVTTQNINSHPMSSGDAVTEDKPVSNGDNETPGAEEKYISRASVVLQTPGFQHVLEDEKGKLRIWPYSDFDNSDKLPVTLHRVKKGINIPGKKGMSSNMTVIQSVEHSAEMPEDRIVHKYHSSSILPADRTTGQIMKAHGESVQSVLLQDANGNNVSEEEIASVLPKIAETISKMDNSNAEEILPGITQSITKLKSGGNLVITTMTRKLDEEESSSSGRGSPEPDYPVLNVDDLENSKIYLVQDSKGELFYVEDVTSESQESAYFSSRNTSESVSDTGNSPTFERISTINSVGESGIKQSTAHEILSAMYGDSGVKELKENEEEWSERTYEYDLPRRSDSGKQKEYSKDSFKTSYMVEEPGDTLPRMKSATTKDRYESSYQMSGGSPWVYDGGMAQSYSQVTQGAFLDEANSVSAVSTHNVDNSGMKTIERITIEGEAIDYPAPAPVFVPPMVVQTHVPEYSLVKVDVTPKYKDEGVMAQIEAPKPEEPTERPIYKTVAHIQTPEKVPSPKPVEKKKYKIIASKATEKEEEQETHMRFDEIDYKFSAENVEYTMKPATAETQYFVRNTTKLQPENHFRSEKRIELGKSSDRKYKSQIQVQEPKPEVYEQSSYSYDQMKSELEQSESNMRVVRGSYLIKNSLDDSGTALDDNINMFDRNFTMCKDNPLYHSDEDLYRRLERERIENARRQERLQRDLNQDITFETVDRFSKSKAVKREPEKPRQSLYELLMSRLSTIDAKDIRQNIDVKHNAEDIYGDPRFLQADGEYLRNTAGTNNFETVGEKVDLMLKEGKAFITVRVTAERITPIDLEFNVWRKNQAIVTRTIEVDLLATEHRRRLYYKVMDQPAGGSHSGYRAGPNETVLDSKETLELFSKILGAADGEGDTEDIEVKTRSGKTTRPFSSGMDLLY